MQSAQWELLPDHKSSFFLEEHCSNGGHGGSGIRFLGPATSASQADDVRIPGPVASSSHGCVAERLVTSQAATGHDEEADDTSLLGVFL
jgi:hypothetical protein